MTATQIVTTGHRAPRKKMTRKKWQTVIWFVALLAITAIVIYPLLWLFASTFKPNSEFGQNQGLILSTRRSRTTARSWRASAACRCGGSSRTRRSSPSRP